MRHEGGMWAGWIFRSPIFFLVSVCQHHAEYFSDVVEEMRKMTIIVNVLSIPAHRL